MEGDYKNAGISFAATIPVVGSLGTTCRVVKTATKVSKTSEKISDAKALRAKDISKIKVKTNVHIQKFRDYIFCPEKSGGKLEDLLQVSYTNGYLLDLGWHPEFDANGTFKIQVIKDRNWDNPIYFRECREKKI